MSFFGKIRDALFGSTPEVAPDAPSAPDATQPAAPETKTAALQQTGAEFAADIAEEDKVARDAAKRQEAPPSSPKPRRSSAKSTPTSDLYAAAVDLKRTEAKGDLTSEEFIELAEEVIKTLQADTVAVDKLLTEHTQTMARLKADYAKSMEALLNELLPNLEKVTWERLMKLTGFNMKNPPIGNPSPEVLAKVRAELGLFIAHSDRFTLGQKIERDKKTSALFRRVDALGSKVAYTGEIAERYSRAKGGIAKHAANIGKHIESARAHPRRRISQRDAESFLGREALKRRRFDLAVLKKIYERCTKFEKYQETPSYGQVWFWWYVFTGGYFDRTFRPKEIEDYIREHPEYKPPVPRPPGPGPGPEPEPWPEPWPVPWPAPWPEPWPAPWPTPWPEPWPEPAPVPPPRQES